MKKLTALLLGSLLLIGVVACESNTSNTSASAPGSTDESGKVPTAETVQDNKQDAQDDIRRKQLDADIRAREQRNNVTGGDAIRADSDISSEVRSKLEANIPSSQLTVTSKEGTVIVSGSVQNKEQLNKIEPLAMQIKGVTNVNVVAKVVPAVENKQ